MKLGHCCAAIFVAFSMIKGGDSRDVEGGSLNYPISAVRATRRHYVVGFSGQRIYRLLTYALLHIEIDGRIRFPSKVHPLGNSTETGLSRLTCGNRYIFESYPPPNPPPLTRQADNGHKNPTFAGSGVPPSYLIPLGQQLNTSKGLGFALLISHNHPNPNQTKEIALPQGFQCRLSLLQPSKQVTRPSRSYRVEPRKGGEPRKGREPRKGGEERQLLVDLAGNIDAINFTRDDHIEWKGWEEFDPLIQSHIDTWIEQLTNTSKKHNKVETVLLEEGLTMRARAKATVGRFKDRIRAMVSGELGALSANSLLSAIMSILKWRLSQGIVPQLADEITSQMNRALPHYAFQPMISQVIEEVTLRVTTKLTGAAEKFSQKAFPPQVAKRVISSLVSSLSRSLVRRIDTDYSYVAASQLTEGLGRTLCKSLTHAIAPALAESLVASPLNDYYCYYCSKHNTYCDYCQLQPSQAYYASYYAGYYSSYLCGYYSSFEADKLLIERDRAYAAAVGADEDEREYRSLYSSGNRQWADVNSPKIEQSVFGLQFSPLYDGKRWEVSSPDYLPTNVDDPEQYWS